MAEVVGRSLSNMGRTIERWGSKEVKDALPPPVAIKDENECINRLDEGNRRYLCGLSKSINKPESEQKLRTRLADNGQEPFAIILSCSDSRVPVERIFDVGPGDLFVVRVAGNITGAPVSGLIGSVEYGVAHLKSKVVLVLGHTKCGAVTTAVKFSKTGDCCFEKLGPNLGAAIDHINPPVSAALSALETLENHEMSDAIDHAIRLNVYHGMEQLMTRSTVAAEAVRERRVEIHGGIYDIATGQVTFLGRHPRERAILREAQRRSEEVESGEPAAVFSDEDDEKSNAVRSGSSKRRSSSSSSSKGSNDCVALGVKPAQEAPAEFVPVSPPDSPLRHRSSRSAVVPGAWAGSPRSSPRAVANGEAREDAEGAGSLIPKFSLMVETKLGRQHIKDVVLDMNNWRAGITVALVSVPLSISLGIASGTTPMRGLGCAVFGGLCAGLFGSSDYNIVGPAGALSGMLMSYTVKWGDDVLPWLSLISAAICAVCGLLRLDTYMLLMPTSVFEGFTVGVALIIGLNQINFACGLAPGTKHALFIMNIIESIKELGATKWPSLIVFLVQAPVLYYLMKKIPKVPWTIIMPLASLPFGVLCDSGAIDVDLLTLKSKYGMLKPELVQPLKPLNAEPMPLMIAAFSIAIVAVLETLISAKIASNRVDRNFSLTGEMRGLTISHVVCGVTGCMPPTGVFVRTSLNTSLGATHRFSQTLNAICVALISLAFMPVFSYLPQATIAAILVVAALRMTPWNYLAKLWKEDKINFCLCLVTAGVCVGEDPVIGLAVGMLLALLISAKKQLTTPVIDITSVADGDSGRAFRVQAFGALTYVNAEEFVKQARTILGASKITLDLTGLRQADHDGISSLGKVVDKWSSGEQPTPKSKICIEGVCDTMLPSLRQSSWFTEAEDEGRVRLRAAAPAKSMGDQLPRVQAVRRGGA
mmetsp:Transcript_9419/g.21573  ORF Transcript_9419/g.21573 Transcript_9419/m.21573 type:complete len:931 (-) Transcript_9419:157-2949(-)